MTQASNLREYEKKPRPVEQMDIVTRLENWGACQRGKGGGAMLTKETRRSSPYGGQGYKCMTDVICTMLRMAANGPTGGGYVQSKLNFTDAHVINSAWVLLGVRHKTLLKDLYVLNRPANVICREMDIKHWPATYFKRELLAAQTAISNLLTSGKN